MTGSEGMLGIVTEITVKLIPKPEKAQVVMAAFDDIRKAGNAVANVIGAGIIPAGMEMMDKIATRAVEEYVHAGYNLEAEAILLCESDGTTEEVIDEIQRINEIMMKSSAIDIKTSNNENERLNIVPDNLLIAFPPVSHPLNKRGWRNLVVLAYAKDIVRHPHH